MFTSRIKDLQDLQTQIEGLKTTIESERVKEFKALPAKYGFSSLPDFIKAVKTAASTSGRKKRTNSAPKPAKGKRVKITPEIKEKVKAAIEAGQTGSQVAKSVGISLPSVQNIKKELGLVKTRS